MWTDEHKALAAKRFGEFAHLCREDQLAEVMTLAVELVRACDGTMTAEELAEAQRRISANAVYPDWDERVFRHITTQGATVATLQAKVAELEKERDGARVSAGASRDLRRKAEEEASSLRSMIASLESLWQLAAVELDALRGQLAMMTDLRDAYRKGGMLEHERANAAEVEAERLWCESWGAAAVISLLLEEGVENFRAAQAGAMATLENSRLAAELAKPRTTEQPVDGCPGPGKCHGSLSWCARCGEVGLLCDMNGRCHMHRDRWLEYVLEHVPVAKLAREEGYEAGRREASMKARKEVESLQDKLRRARTDAWAEAVDVINGEPLTSQEAREAMASVLVQWAEREQAVHPFLALARDRLARVSYELIPLAACTRLLKAFNAGEEKDNG